MTGFQTEKSRTCIKYLMFLSNTLIFTGGLCLLGVGIWVTTNPNGFKNIVTANPFIYTGAYIILSVGVILFFLGCLGCWGAIRESKQLLMIFLLLILIIFILELVAAVLALVFRKQIRKDYFLKELQMKYKGDNSTDAFSKTWNAIMMDFSCCGVNGPQDFGQNSSFHELFPNMLLPEACCKKNNTVLVFLDKNRCFQGGAGYINSKGCFSMIAENFRNYVHLVGAFSIIVLLIELGAMAFTIFVYQTYN
ncbi:tetraspanin-18-like isoform X1 [Chiloscyllium plagiosum]|uniref:tetraspanin-18-like isoform X1 n=1 Tax=Chiloscyllium plagiosum TaxID=36176 RepID=UPI001CB7E4F7|nr:tetraspanin-18-like isoform X1 [Chiloscyllium plagiosum]XP_043572822.1 tetraspanin-18-like isoform X1 [Chiloscyllium plagiosum]XP_043572823.1 tetraspanin-18-like isoform X1 [Chiloscyllium plagiosum]XP_043572824.1 tetraspanin-18-like isoform X1 [Chiloscyllium plagiosum]XP_043572825.1 tetraspanin-18-like isoform X1 [Chiloscyllium plagiosum]XP_043572826.1 tetraspanin-18-like isoform X1 [Chiloscyllium plagiosum]